MPRQLKYSSAGQRGTKAEAITGRRVQRLIGHDPDRNSVHLFLRTTELDFPHFRGPWLTGSPEDVL
jgi:hypothetical protein